MSRVVNKKRRILIMESKRLSIEFGKIEKEEGETLIKKKKFQ